MTFIGTGARYLKQKKETATAEQTEELVVYAHHRRQACLHTLACWHVHARRPLAEIPAHGRRISTKNFNQHGRILRKSFAQTACVGRIFTNTTELEEQEVQSFLRVHVVAETHTVDRQCVRSEIRSSTTPRRKGEHIRCRLLAAAFNLKTNSEMVLFSA